LQYIELKKALILGLLRCKLYAINLLKLQGKPINPYQVAKLSGVDYDTARKYLKRI